MEDELESFMENNLTDDDLEGTIFDKNSLLIFKNSYKGKLPNNGIKQSDFRKLQRLEK